VRATGAVAVIVLDIEGTTTPIAFVYDVLFPFARKHLRAYLADPDNAAALREPLVRLVEESAVEHHLDSSSRRPDVAKIVLKDTASWHRDFVTRGESEAVARYIETLMDRDRKSAGLKLLQGRIWEDGYRRGELRGDVFADVAPALRRWRAAGLDVAIYSSGSELAQRLLFSTTTDGDLTPLVSRFFDTAVGAKQAPDSYRRIAAALKHAPERILFISDVTTELDAATGAGCQVRLCVRPGNRPQPPHAYRIIHSFEEVAP
jgi:enolase-phosphatase E1